MKLYWVESVSRPFLDEWLWVADDDELSASWGLSTENLTQRLSKSDKNLRKIHKAYPDDIFTLICEGTTEECVQASKVFELIGGA